MDEKIVIGIDPGTRVTGYAVLKIASSSIRPLDFGCIRPPPSYLLSDRYQIIFESLMALIMRYGPSEMALETPFMSKNAQSALKLGIAMGSALLAAKSHKMKVFGYTPREVKCFITGTGKADKVQMQNSIARLLSLKNVPQPNDAADALGIAFCHVNAPPALFAKRPTREF